MNEALSESMQDYLEAIYMVLLDKPVCRITDIQKILHVSKPSIVNAVSQLKEKGLINKEKYGYITLTRSGEKKSKRLYRKHTSIRRFLMNLFDINTDRANSIACEIEHHFDIGLIEQMNDISDKLDNDIRLKTEIRKSHK